LFNSWVFNVSQTDLIATIGVSRQKAWQNNMNIGAIPKAYAPAAVVSQSMPLPQRGVAVAANSSTLSTDSFHISVNGNNTGKPGAQIRFTDHKQAQHEFGSAVHVDTPPAADAKKFLGMVRLTSSQEQQIKAVEAQAFQRFENPGNNAQRGSIYAKIQQSKT